MHLLHVEDNPVDADLTHRQLQQSIPDLKLTLATTLQQARNYLQQDATQLDLALIDLKLPDGNGLELLQLIREQQWPLAVVILTGSGDQNAVVSALKAGADDYLVKELGHEQRLLETIDSALQHFRQTSHTAKHALHVLYAEHNHSDIDLTTRHLKKHAPHIHLTTVTDASQALKKLPTTPDQHCDFDVLLLDYRLPTLDALQLTKELRQHRKLKIPIVLITGQGNEELAVKAIRHGVNDYLTKHNNYLHELPTTLEKTHQEYMLEREHQQLLETSSQLRQLVSSSQIMLYELRYHDGLWTPGQIKGDIQQLLGYSERVALRQNWWQKHLHPEDREQAITQFSNLLTTGHLSHEYRFISATEEILWLHDEIRVIFNQHGEPVAAHGIWRDITTNKQNEQIQKLRLDVLEQLSQDQPLTKLMTTIAKRLEQIRPQMMVSILLLDTVHNCLTNIAAPSLPGTYCAAIENLPVAFGVGSCGTAAALGEQVFVEDIATHPFWKDYVGLALQAGLRACWSSPIKNSKQEVLGTFAIYSSEPKTPTREERELIDEFTYLSTLAIERFGAASRMRQAEVVFQNAREGLVVTDLDYTVLNVNPAYCDITGYRRDETIGTTTSILKSGKHDNHFFSTLKQQLKAQGFWQGEIWNRRKDGEIYPQFLAVSTVYGLNGQPSHYVGVMTDISQIKNSEQRLHHLAHYDPLTDLPNRVLLQLKLQHAIDQAERSNKTMAVLFIDLDRFKNVNDSLGHGVGDELLLALTQRLCHRLRDEDTLCRISGDEFLLLLEHIDRPEDAAGVAQTILDLLRQSFLLPSNHEVYISASIGICVYPDDGTIVEDLIQHADIAMYQAKEQGRNTYRFYTRAMTERVSQRLDMESNLRRGLDNDEFVLNYQPQVASANGKIIGCEVLLRWQPPDQKMIPPDRFIPLAEETGLIVPIGNWVLRTACIQAREWIDQGIAFGTMAVNLSAVQLNQAEIATTIGEILQQTGLPPEHLRLELTESMIMERGPQAIALLQSLKDLGVTLSIDDFGTGYSSLAYLKLFPVDELKIDQSFVRDLSSDINDREIAATIIAMARTFNLAVVAEGVETQTQLDFLIEQNCPACQGYLFSRPLSATTFAELVKQNKPLNRKVDGSEA